MKIQDLNSYKHIDICCNTKFKNKHIDDVLEDSKNNNVLPIVVSGGIKGNQYVNSITKFPITLGIHPHSAKDVDTFYIENLYNTKKDNLIAFGECGLDYDRMYSPKEKQLEIFEKQLQIAKELNKPVILHERCAVDDFIKIIEKYKPKGVVHCFTGDKDTVRKYIEMNLYIGITGWITDTRRNQELIESLKYIPLDKLLIETDSPYLKPRGYNIEKTKGENYPKYVKYVLADIADKLGKDEEGLREFVFRNTCNLFRLEEE